jgi:hypothetical protein
VRWSKRERFGARKITFMPGAAKKLRAQIVLRLLERRF